MKRIITLILAFVMLLSVCGCKSNDSENNSSVAEIIEVEEIIVDETGSQITSNVSSAENDSDSQKNDASSQGSTSSTASNKETVTIDYNTVTEVDICDPIIRAYLDADTPKQQYAMLNDYKDKMLDYQILPLEWQVDGSHIYTIYLSENADFSDSTILTIGSPDKLNKNSICVPGKTYYWKVFGIYSDEPMAGGKIKIKDAPVRWVKLDGVNNVRDMGGWKTESGKTVSYEKIYRGAMLDEITNNGLDTLKALGIKTDIDVRSTASWDTHSAVERTGLKYYFIDSDYSYEGILNEYREIIGTNLQELFELLADESNYPIYLHCGGGTDRTGTYSFILNGLLGVSYEDLTRDYELTSYAGADRWRGNGTGGTFAPDDLIHENVSNSQEDASWGVLNKKFMESKYCTDGKLSTAIENFLLDRGVKQEHIDAYKNIMLK